jgi:polysaccharide biosynthesis/export protein
MKIFFISLLLISSVSAFGQADLANLEALEGMLEKSSLGGNLSANESDSYTSFTQNEYQNVVKQLSQAEKGNEQDVLLSELQEKRMELAIKLCKKDPRTCFLIDEYKEFKALQSPEKIEDLELFGLEIFSGFPLSNSLIENTPMSPDYVIRSGDLLGILITGSIKFNEKVKVENDGYITVPEVGRFSAGGLTLRDLNDLFRTSINNRYTGSEGVIFLDQIRANQVYVLGAIPFPGQYAISAQSSLVNLLASSGGIQENTSLRNIRHMRNGKLIESIDLYDLLIDGKVNLGESITSSDVILFSGVENIISILGEVNRPAKYEIVTNQTLAEVIGYALGYTPLADLDRIIIRRVTSSQETLYIPRDEIASFKLVAGDEVLIQKSTLSKSNYVSIEGEIRNAGDFSYSNAKSLGEIIDLKKDLLETTYTGYAIIKKFQEASKTWIIQTFDLFDQNNINKILLNPGDKIYIFSKNDVSFLRSRSLYDFLFPKKAELDYTKINTQIPLNTGVTDFRDSESQRLNSDLISCFKHLMLRQDSFLNKTIKIKLSQFQPNSEQACTEIFDANPDLLPSILAHSIPVNGDIRISSIYPISNNLSVSEIILLAGGLRDEGSQIFQLDVVNKEGSIISGSLDEVGRLSNIAAFNVKNTNTEINFGSVKLAGEFKNPGVYQIAKDTTYSSLVERAGGLNVNAYPLGGIFLRDSIREREAVALLASKRELGSMMSTAVSSGYFQQGTTDLIAFTAFLSNISSTIASGRMIAELRLDKIKNDPTLNTILKDGDEIYMPTLDYSVTVVGSVNNPVTTSYKYNQKFATYIADAGGYRSEANKSKVYVILPNGKAVTPSLSLFGLKSTEILPGSTIIVPRQSRTFDSIALIETVTPILANLSVTAASIAAISDN